jgi:hypothetical protein
MSLKTFEIICTMLGTTKWIVLQLYWFHLIFHFCVKTFIEIQCFVLSNFDMFLIVISWITTIFESVGWCLQDPSQNVQSLVSTYKSHNRYLPAFFYVQYTSHLILVQVEQYVVQVLFYHQKSEFLWSLSNVANNMFYPNLWKEEQRC